MVLKLVPQSLKCKMHKKISKNGIMKWNPLELLKNYLTGNIYKNYHKHIYRNFIKEF
jgi:hypothetical protein